MSQHPSMASPTRVALAAYLHDIGKLAERAGVFTADPRLESNLYLYSPFRDERGMWFSHKHAAHPALALDARQRPSPHEPEGDVAPIVGRRRVADGGEAQDPTDSLINAAASHNNPPLAYAVDDREEACEQHAAAVLVRHFPQQVPQDSRVVAGLGIANRVAVGAQSAAQSLEVVGQVVGGPGFANGLRHGLPGVLPSGRRQVQLDSMRSFLKSLRLLDIPGSLRRTFLDRGKNVERAPWFEVFEGERINDYYLMVAEKRSSREKAGRG